MNSAPVKVEPPPCHAFWLGERAGECAGGEEGGRGKGEGGRGKWGGGEQIPMHSSRRPEETGSDRQD